MRTADAAPQGCLIQGCPLGSIAFLLFVVGSLFSAGYMAGGAAIGYDYVSLPLPGWFLAGLAYLSVPYLWVLILAGQRGKVYNADVCNKTLLCSPFLCCGDLCLPLGCCSRARVISLVGPSIWWTRAGPGRGSHLPRSQTQVSCDRQAE